MTLGTDVRFNSEVLYASFFDSMRLEGRRCG